MMIPSSSPPSSRHRRLPQKQPQQAQRDLRSHSKRKSSFLPWSSSLQFWHEYLTAVQSRHISVARLLTYISLIIMYDCLWGPYSITSSSSQTTPWLLLLSSTSSSSASHQNQILVPPRRDIPIDRPLLSRPPTHHACDGYNGIFHIQSGDVGGASGTIFFQFVLAQLYYAKQYHFKPWVFLNNISHYVYDWHVHGTYPGVNVTMLDGLSASYQPDPRHFQARFPGKPKPTLPLPLPQETFWFIGDGVWEHYFEPVSDFVPGDRSCERKPRLTMDLWLITPGLHIYAPWTPRMWKYDILPDYMLQRHVPLSKWLLPQRIMAHELTLEYIQPKPFLWNLAERYVPSRRNRTNDHGAAAAATKTKTTPPPLLFPGNTSQYALGIHVRWSDKEGGRRKIAVDEFLPYVQEYVREGGRKIFVATDSNLVLRHMLTKWPEPIQALIVSQGQDIVRSDTATPVFTMASHHRTNVEILVDILALSNCAFLLHGLSAVSDSAMYVEYDLIYQSINLEDPLRPKPDEFGKMVHMVMTGQVTDGHYWHDHTPKEWWDVSEKNTSSKEVTALTDSSTNSSNSDTCHGYDGILHIAVGGDSDAGADMVVFHYILNQLLYADMYNLKPWIYLSNRTLMYDEQAHGAPVKISINPHMNINVVPPNVTLKLSNETLYYPDAPNVSLATHTSNASSNNASSSSLQEPTLRLAGNGVWGTYLEPVSDFNPNDSASCHQKPLVSLEYAQVLSGLSVAWPWAIRPWRLDGLQDPVLWKPPNTTLQQYYEPMRLKAHDLVRKYYRFHPYILQQAEQVNPVTSDRLCLAMHIRQSVRGGKFRKRTPLKTFREYAKAFLRAGGNCIYLSIDSWRAWDDIHEKWPESVREVMKTLGDYVVRNVRNLNVYDLEPDAHHRINSEVLVDVLAMSKCHFLIHGNSAMSEAAIYLNLNLHQRSINVEEENAMSVEQFENMVQKYERPVHTEVKSDK